MQTRTGSQKRIKPRSPYAVELRRLGHKVKPSKKVYTRKGRSKDRPFDVSDPTRDNRATDEIGDIAPKKLPCPVANGLSNATPIAAKPAFRRDGRARPAPKA